MLAAVALAVAIVAGAPDGPPPENGAEVMAVVRLEQDWLAHIDDRATLERILADDFVHAVPPGAFLDKRAHIAWAAGHPRPAGEHRRFERLSVRPFGEAAVAMGVVATHEADGAPERRSLFTDVFVRRGGQWMAVSAQETPLPPTP